MRAPRAFTLIELLVVISIVALLIGVLLPALGAVRDHGRSIKCLSNVRQIAAAAYAYATDNAAFLFPPSQMYGGTPYFTAFEDGGYVPDTSQVHRCPKDEDAADFDSGARVTSYAVNGYFAPNHDPYGDPPAANQPPGTGDGDGEVGERGVALEDVVDPAKKVYAAEIIEALDRDHFMPMFWGTAAAIHPNPNAPPAARTSQLDGGVPRAIDRDRHDERSNYAFADGHGALHAFTDTWDDTIADRADRDANGKADGYDPLYDSP